MMDDPLISTNLEEFLSQIQGGLLQGSAASGYDSSYSAQG